MFFGSCSGLAAVLRGLSWFASIRIIAKKTTRRQQLSSLVFGGKA